MNHRKFIKLTDDYVLELFKKGHDEIKKDFDKPLEIKLNKLQVKRHVEMFRAGGISDSELRKKGLI